MQYKIIVDKQPSSNPSSEKKEYIIDIEELRFLGDVYDTLNIELDRTYVTRRLQLSEYGVLTILDEPVIEELTEVNIELFEGDNYIYISDMQGNHFYAEYLVKNDFTDTFVTENKMNSAISQSAQSIELSVSQTLQGYSTTEEMMATIQVTADEINAEVNKKVGNDELGTKITQNWESVQIAWNKITNYIQFINAMLQIKDSNNNLLMTLNNNGQDFYDSGTLFGHIGTSRYNKDTSQKGLIFGLNPNGKFMSWGKQDETGGDYIVKLYYASNNSFGKDKEGIYLSIPINANNGLYFSGNDINLHQGTYSDGTDYPGIIIGDNVNSNFAMFTRQQTMINSTNGLTINGRQVLTDTSDGRLKNNIKNSEISGINRIKEIKHRQFNWNKDNKYESIGYIAQELEEIDENYVVKNPQYDEKGNIIDNIYQVNSLPIIATATKAIAELTEKLEEKENTINKLLLFINRISEKLNMQEDYNKTFNSTKNIKSKVKSISTLDNMVNFENEIKYSNNIKIPKHTHFILKKDGNIEEKEVTNG